MLSSTVKKVYERSHKNLFWSFKNSGEILKLEISMRPVCLLMIFLLFTMERHIVLCKDMTVCPVGRYNVMLKDHHALL